MSERRHGPRRRQRRGPGALLQRARQNRSAEHRRARRGLGAGVLRLPGRRGHAALWTPRARLKGGRRGRTLAQASRRGGDRQTVGLDSRHNAIDLRDRALLELLYGTGARVSEVVNLDLSDLDFDEELILVTGKGNKQRLVPIGATCDRALREYLGPGGRPSLSSVQDARPGSSSMRARVL